MEAINIWGMLGCAVAHAGALFAAVEGLGDHLLQRTSATTDSQRNALRMKTAAKVAAALITVITAGVVLLLDSNWVAFAILSVAFIAVMAWVVRSYRQADRV